LLLPFEKWKKPAKFQVKFVGKQAVKKSFHNSLYVVDEIIKGTDYWNEADFIQDTKTNCYLPGGMHKKEKL